jgi:DNA modification methylase
MKYQIINGNNINVLKTFPDNHFDSIVTDPPYGIDFLGKTWDANTGALETYQECLRVLKPGGHILAFSAARTYHHLAITLEQAGFDAQARARIHGPVGLNINAKSPAEIAVSIMAEITQVLRREMA